MGNVGTAALPALTAANAPAQDALGGAIIAGTVIERTRARRGALC